MDWSLPHFTPDLYMQLCSHAYVWKWMYIYKMIGYQKGGNLLPWQNNVTRWTQALTYCVELIKTYSLGNYFCIGIMTSWAPACAPGRFSCVWLCDSRTIALQSPSVYGILQARILEWFVMASSRWSSQPKGQTSICYVSCIDRWVFTT